MQEEKGEDLTEHLVLSRLLPGRHPWLVGMLCGRSSLYLGLIKMACLLLCHVIAVDDDAMRGEWAWVFGAAVVLVSLSQLLLLDARVAIQLTMAFELHFVAVRLQPPMASTTNGFNNRWRLAVVCCFQPLILDLLCGGGWVERVVGVLCQRGLAPRHTICLKQE